MTHNVYVLFCCHCIYPVFYIFMTCSISYCCCYKFVGPWNVCIYIYQFATTLTLKFRLPSYFTSFLGTKVHVNFKQLLSFNKVFILAYVTKWTKVYYNDICSYRLDLSNFYCMLVLMNL